MHGAIGWAIRRLAVRLVRDGELAFSCSMPDRGFHDVQQGGQIDFVDPTRRNESSGRGTCRY
ncbi:hypothetical protein ASD55_14925 [Rhodanobacter sp. Root561]|nr:hypothetical protein ASD55_14925 [Rhodanobacter sp. Root561]